MRLQGWEKILDNYMFSRAPLKFEWGKTDCLTFASDWCVSCVGSDPMSKKRKNDPDTIRGKYSSAEEAYRLIKELRKSIPDIMDCHFDRKPVNFTQRGDVVLGKINGLKTFGIFYNNNFVYKTLEEGFHMTKEKPLISWEVC